MEKGKRIALGNSGAEVSRVCLGAMLMGTVMNREDSFRVLDDYYGRGCDFIDTANCYAWWIGKGENVGDESELLLGEWMKLRNNREKLFIATKAGARLPDSRAIRNADGVPRWEEAPSNYEGASAKTLKKAIDGSLARLGTDYVDLYYIHVDDRKTPLEETLGALNEMVVSGKVRHIGYSNVLTWRLERIRAICEKNGWAMPVAVQQEFSYLRASSAFDPGIAAPAGRELFDFMKENPGMTLLAYSPLLKGIYASEEKRRAYYNWAAYDTPDSAARLKRLDEVSRQLGVDGNTLVLAWMLHLRPGIIPLLGFSRAEQYFDNMKALDVSLDKGTMDFLNI